MFTLFFVPETKGKSSEDILTIFSDSNINQRLSKAGISTSVTETEDKLADIDSKSIKSNAGKVESEPNPEMITNKSAVDTDKI